ncbi:hypothetical protein OC846_002035 [Tilletia horrida]|uniref:STEEP1 domain-containing protein n=1 Tax=Tilletia horrida TaxID=155126 RepID=A0AAN6GT08_9BASI|nr:hypothetical protein OC846_002035 [Tilletia horrida]
MPKVVSRSVISASNDDARDEDRKRLVPYYCCCGEFVLVCDAELAALPRRPLDGSYVLRCLDSPKEEGGGVRKARVFKISAKQRDPVLLQRPDGTLERQYRFYCSRCELPVGYEATPPPLKSGNFTYILQGALT